MNFASIMTIGALQASSLQSLRARATPALTSTESATNVSFDPWFDPWLPCDFAKSITAGVARSPGAQQPPPRPQLGESGELIKIVAATEVRARQTEARSNNWLMWWPARCRTLAQGCGGAG